MEVKYQGYCNENGDACDFMLVSIGDTDLYAEMPIVEGDEDATYAPLKEEIIAQAKANGIDPRCLKFWRD